MLFQSATSLASTQGQDERLTRLESPSLTRSRPRTLSGGTASSSAFPLVPRLHQRTSDQHLSRSDVANSNFIHRQTSAPRPGQPPNRTLPRSELRYTRFESTYRIASGKMLYEETEEVQRVTYPARSRSRSKKAVRFAPSPTSPTFDPIRGNHVKGPSADRADHLRRSSTDGDRRAPPLPSTTLGSASRERSQISLYSDHPRSVSTYQTDPYRPHHPPSVLSEQELKGQYGLPRSRPIAYSTYSSPYLKFPPRPHSDSTSHAEKMRAQAEHLSACLIRRPLPPPMPPRPTSDFFIFCPDEIIPGFQILRELGSIRNLTLQNHMVEDRVRRECESDQQMREANAMILFQCEPMGGVRRGEVRVSGIAVEICPRAPRASLVHEFV